MQNPHNRFPHPNATPPPHQHPTSSPAPPYPGAAPPPRPGAPTAPMRVAPPYQQQPQRPSLQPPHPPQHPQQHQQQQPQQPQQHQHQHQQTPLHNQMGAMSLAQNGVPNGHAPPPPSTAAQRPMARPIAPPRPGAAPIQQPSQQPPNAMAPPPNYPPPSATTATSTTTSTTTRPTSHPPPQQLPQQHRQPPNPYAPRPVNTLAPPSASPTPPPANTAAATAPTQYARPYPPSNNMPVRPGGHAAAMRPNPAAVPSRPLPPGAGAYPHPPNGPPPMAPPGTHPPPNVPPPGVQPPTANNVPPAPQLTTSMMPRPASLACGQPRVYYHRGMNVGGDERTTIAIPNSNADFISVDDGCARIRFARLTTNAIASEPNVMTKTGVPLAIVTTPFANVAQGETPVPVVDFSTGQVGGPLRCERCNAYANPGFKFLNGGAEFQCNLCTFVNKTPQEHFSPISHTGQRLDADSRHELRVGSVEYIVGSSDYWIRPPRPACYLFAVDVSAGAVSSGLASAAMMSIKSAIGAGLLPGSGQGARVAIMTFDRSLQFFDARGAEEGKSVSVQCVPDVVDPFVPLGGDALFLTPEQAVLAVETAVEIHGLGPESANNPERAQTPPHVECALGSALQAVKQAFADCGGKAFVVAGSLPTIGVHKLERRGGGALGAGEEREMALLKEANSSYDILGCELAEVQASVDLFLASSSVYIDAATLSRVPRACGGRMHLFTGFDPIRDGASLHRSLCVAASEPRAFESLLRVRTSPGLETKGEYVGHFGRPQRGDDVAGPVFDASSTIALELAVTSKLLGDGDDGQNRPYSVGTSLYDDVCVQTAILFTDCAGRRRIRVHSVFAKKTSVLSEVFSHADVDATAAFLVKKVSSAVLVGGTSFSKAWEAVTEKTSQMFYVYRKHCTTSPVNGQLILPESYKVLPVMMLGLIKSAALRKTAGSVQAGDAVTVDERAAALSFLISGTMSEIAAMCYPRMWEVQSVPKEAGVPLPKGTDPAVTENGGGQVGEVEEPISLPNTLPLSAESLTDERILLVENGMQMVVWIGGRVDGALTDSIATTGIGGRVVIRGETANSVALLKDVSEDGKRVGRIIQRIAAERKGLSRPQVVERNKPGAGGEAKWMMPLLVEDRGNGGTYSYVEYLKTVHKRVMDKMTNDSAQSDLQTWEMLNHGY